MHSQSKSVRPSDANPLTPYLLRALDTCYQVEGFAPSISPITPIPGRHCDAGVTTAELQPWQFPGLAPAIRERSGFYPSVPTLTHQVESPGLRAVQPGESSGGWALRAGLPVTQQSHNGLFWGALEGSASTLRAILRIE